jgi:hypothetical protein
MMNRNQNLFLALGALIFASVAGCQGGGGGGDVAKVDTETITAEEFASYLKTKPTVRVNVDGQVAELPVANSLAFQAMQDLVGKKIVISLAKEAKVAPTDAEVETEIKFRNELTPGYLQQLKDQGLSTAQIRREVYYSLAQERLITKGVAKIPMAEVEDYIKKNPERFIEPASVVMDLIYVPDQKARDTAEADFKKGASFETVKQRYDKAPADFRRAFDASVQTNTGMPLERLSAEFKAAVAKTSPGSVSAWIPANPGFAKLKVVKKNAKKDIKITEERKQWLQRQMMIERGGKGSDLQQKIAKKMRESNIQVTEESVKDQWPKFMEQLKKQGAATP